MSKKTPTESQTMKVIKRLRNDPKYLDIEKKALGDPENVTKYANQVIKQFRLDAGWKIKLQHYLLNPEFNVAFTGASIQPYLDPITKETRYMIPVSPDTTQANVKSAHKRIIARYREAELRVNLRDDDSDRTKMQILAYRLKESGKTIPEILEILAKKYPDESLINNDISLLIEEGQEKKLG